MAATVALSESNGAGEVVYDGAGGNGIANINFGSTDAPELVTTLHPIRPSIPRSFPKFLRVLLVSLGGSTFINDLRVWKFSGAFSNFDNIVSGGLTILNEAGQGYITPNNLVVLASGHPAVPTADPGAQNLGIAGFNNSVDKHMPTDTGGTVPARSNYFAQQCQINVGGTSALGPLSQKVYLIQYDES